MTLPLGSGTSDNDEMRHSERLVILETKWESVIPTLATKADTAQVIAEIRKVDSSIKTWMVGTMIGLMIGFGGLFMTVTNSWKQPAPVSQQPSPPPAPIILQPQFIMPSPVAPAGR